MKLKTRLTILFSLLALIPLLLVSYLGYLNQRDVLLRQTVRQLVSVADIQEIRIGETLDRYIESVKLVTSKTQLRISLNEFNTSGDTSEQARLQRIIADAKNSVSEIRDISVLNPQGIVVASTEASEVGMDRSGDQFFEFAQRVHGLNEIFRNIDNILHARLSGPLVLDGELVGVVEVVASSGPLFAVTEDRSGLGDTGEIILAKTNASGDAVFLTPLRFDAGAALSRAIPKTRTDIPMIPAVSGIEDVFIAPHAVDYRNESVFAVTRFVDALGWGLVVKIDRDEALAPVAELARSYVSVVTLSGLLIILMALLVTNAFVKPLQLLTKAAQNIQAGIFSVRAQVRAGGEIGTLVNTFNTMAQDLERLYGSLEIEVEQKTKSLSHALTQMKEQNTELESTKKAMINVLEDVEEEKDKTESLAKDLEKFQLAVESTSDHIIITNADGIILFANNAVERITGFALKEVIGKKAGTKDLWGGLMEPEFYKNMWETLTVKKKAFSGEIKNKRKNGSEYWALSSISPVLGDDGGVEFFVAIERDITREKQIDQAKTEFVSLASHQLRTPLSTINWYAEMLLAGDAGKITDDQKQYLQEIYTGNQRMVALVNALLNVSRIELGTFMVEPEAVDLAEHIEVALKELKPRIDEKNLAIEKDIDTSLEKYYGDPKLLMIIFQNLLSNAVKYTPDKGKIAITLTSNEARGALHVIVTDSGLGIPQDQQEKIFSKLFRADNVKESDTTGTGLGLYIVKAILDETGGRVWFESEQDKGATFFVDLPIEGMKQKEGSKPLE